MRRKLRVPDADDFAVVVEWMACETCEGIGLVEKDGPAGVPHVVECPPCEGAGRVLRAIVSFTKEQATLEVTIAHDRYDTFVAMVCDARDGLKQAQTRRTG